MTATDNDPSEPPLDQILHDDCLEALARMPEACVDLVFADPPYNLQLKGDLTRPEGGRVDGVDAAWDRFRDFDAYDAFTCAWLQACRRVLKPDGAIWVIGAYHNIFRVGAILQDLGYWILNDVVWIKTNPMPNFRGKRLQNAHETLIWAARDSSGRPRLNYHAGKAGNDDKQMRSDWTLSICAGAERLKDSKGRKLHPTQKPEALLHRVLTLSSAPGDVVLDPFSGVGTTAAVAKRLGRRFIGVEREAAYVAAARRRVATVAPAADALTAPFEGARAEPRVAFGALVERGDLTPGQKLFCPEKRRAAIVRADGTISFDREAGSIHKMGARAMRAEACNGWTFWHFETQRGALAPIDLLRRRVREEMRGA